MGKVEPRNVWVEFLRLRGEVIAYFRAQGDSFEVIASQLSCDPVQVEMIAKGGFRPLEYKR